MQPTGGRMRTRAAAIGVLVLATLATPAPAKQRIVKLKVGPFPIESLRDREICQAFRIKNVPGMALVSWEARSRVTPGSSGESVGSHHLVAYGYKGGESGTFPKGVHDDPGCAEFGPIDFFRERVFLAGSGGESQRGNWTITQGTMPGNLTQALPNTADAPGDAIVVVNSHYFNTTQKRGRGLVKLRLKLAPLDPGKRLVRQVIHGQASWDIKVAPGATGTVTSSFQADGSPNDATEGGLNPSGDVCIFALTTHMHKRGQRFTIAYDESGGTTELLDWEDYLHPGTLLRPPLGATRALLRAYTEANGWPRIRYGCTHANGAEGVEPKLGCEETPGVAPGLSQAEVGPIENPLGSHAQPCGKDGVNCDGRACVPANLVFGPLSDDEMCILTALVHDPIPGAPPERACDVSY